MVSFSIDKLNETGFEELKESEIQSLVEHDKEAFKSYADMAQDSFYPLVTKNPDQKKEFTLKITDNKLNQVFSDESQ